jgi:hypothetical protein
MNTLILKYERKTFFGSREYTEDRKDNATAEDVKKAFNYLKKDKDAAIELNRIVAMWDTTQDFDNGVVSVYIYQAANNCEHQLMSIAKAKKLITDLLQ